jgi:hypothetical protein
MSGFNNWTHIDRINEEYSKRFFQDLPAVAETLDPDAAVMFVENLAPVGDDLPKYIAEWESVIPKIEKFERVAT